MRVGLRRKRVASKANKLIKVAQGEFPPVVDEGPEEKPAPPMGPPKEELEEEVKEDIEQGEELESIGDKIDNLSEKMEDLVSVIEVVVEKAISSDEEKEEEFKEFKEEDEKKDTFTSEEFGIEPEELIVSKEENTMDLRKARKARLQKKLEEAKKEKKTAETMADQFELSKDKKIKQNTPAPPHTKVKHDEVPPQYKIAELALDLSKDKSKWTVLRACEDGKEEPLYEISAPEDKIEEFATEEFAKGVLMEMKEDGVEETLEKYNAKKIEAGDVVVVQETAPEVESVVEPVIEEPVVETTATEETAVVEEPVVEEPVIEATDSKQDMENYKRRFSRAFRLAISAMNKNLRYNPLKFALFDELERLDLDELSSKNVIEAAFNKAATEHIEHALSEAEKYLEMSDEAFVEVESQIEELETAPVEVEATPMNQLSNEASALRKRASDNSIPIVTATEDQADNLAEAISRAMPKPKILENKDAMDSVGFGNKRR
jgi:hypothetical protein